MKDTIVSSYMHSRDFVDSERSPKGSIQLEASACEIRCELKDDKGSTLGLILINKSEWDTEHFGLGVGKMRIVSFDVGVNLKDRRCLLGKAKVAAASNGFDVLFARVPLSDSLTVHSLEAEGAFLTDVLLTYSRPVNCIVAGENRSVDIEIVEASENDEEDLANIAREVFKVDHFHMDPKLPRDKCASVFSKWVSNSLKGLVDVVFVAKRGDVSIGFVTCRVVSDDSGRNNGFIELMGVKNGFERKGIGSLLLSVAMEWFSTRAEKVYVGTQAANNIAIRLYERMGFRQVSSEVTFHLWVS